MMASPIALRIAYRFPLFHTLVALFQLFFFRSAAHIALYSIEQLAIRLCRFTHACRSSPRRSEILYTHR